MAGGTYTLSISFSAIEDHIQCSICLSAIRGAVLTPCGHRYCTRCITEWVGRNHTCPCCNSALNASQFYPDVQFDGLVDSVLCERDKAEEEYYNKLFSTGTPEPSENSRTQNKNIFENILKKHMKASMLSHQKYFDNLHSEYQRKIILLENGLSSGKSLEASHGASLEDIKTSLAQNLQESENLAADAFDRYLTDNVPSLEMVPVTVSVYIADKDVRIKNVVISPSDSLSVIKPIIHNEMRQRSNEVVSWADDEARGVKLLFGPLLKRESYNVHEAVNHLGQGEAIYPLQWDSKLILQHSMRPGSEIVLYEVMQCESDLPSQCFSDLYVPGAGQSCDYFTCSQCRVNWICKSCIQCCHQGHEMNPFALNHKPTWACCYCPKKKLCRIKTASMAVR